MNNIVEKPINGVELYRGPSSIDGKDIAVVATCLKRRSKNVKTGPMIQTYLFGTCWLPTMAKNLGADFSVCGDCPARKGCYVNLRETNAVWNSWVDGRIPKFEVTKHAEMFVGKKIRFGTYGDPAAAPLSAWSDMMKLCSGWTGYTQRWAALDVHEWGWLMASSMNPTKTVEAEKLGWRVFTISKTPIIGSRLCPASQGKTTCNKCSTCCGNKRSRAKSIWTRPHGPKAKYLPLPTG